MVKDCIVQGVYESEAPLPMRCGLTPDQVHADQPCTDNRSLDPEGEGIKWRNLVVIVAKFPKDDGASWHNCASPIRRSCTAIMEASSQVSETIGIPVTASHDPSRRHVACVVVSVVRLVVCSL